MEFSLFYHRNSGMRLARSEIGKNAQKPPAIVAFARLFLNKEPYPQAGKNFSLDLH